MNDIKQVLVVRTKYSDGKGGFKKLTMGKESAQCSHASTAWLACRLKAREAYNSVAAEIMNYFQDKNETVMELDAQFTPVEIEWLAGLNKKVVVCVETEEELISIYNKAKEANLLTYMIEDEGLTEFGGVKTKTCLALGPDLSEKIDTITGHLKLR